MKKLLFLFFFQQAFAQNISPNGTTIETRFSLPDGYKRTNTEQNSFGQYLRSFSLKSANAKVYFFDGKEKSDAQHAAVLDIDRGNRDLQQCADAVMRLRAEYFYKQNKLNQISFKNFQNIAMTYEKYQQGFRMTNKGFQKTKPTDYSEEGFRKYLDMVFNYANTYTLEHEMKAINLEKIQIGDVFIVSNIRSIGHAMIVVDLAENPMTKDKIFLLAQSYMPAQDIHVVKNPKGGVWYSLKDLKTDLITPEWTFPISSLHRF